MKYLGIIAGALAMVDVGSELGAVVCITISTGLLLVVFWEELTGLCGRVCEDYLMSMALQKLKRDYHASVDLYYVLKAQEERQRSYYSFPDKHIRIIYETTMSFMQNCSRAAEHIRDARWSKALGNWQLLLAPRTVDYSDESNRRTVCGDFDIPE